MNWDRLIIYKYLNAKKIWEKASTREKGDALLKMATYSVSEFLLDKSNIDETVKKLVRRIRSAGKIELGSILTTSRGGTMTPSRKRGCGKKSTRPMW